MARENCNCTLALAKDALRQSSACTRVLYGAGARWLCARIVLGDSGLTTYVRWRDYEARKMSDTYTLELKNFRSIRDVSMDIAPLTVVYGPNGAGSPRSFTGC